MTTFFKHNCFVGDIMLKKHNPNTDVLKCLLSMATAQNWATLTTSANLSEIAANNGYITGGITMTVVSSAQTAGTYKLTLQSFTITASGGSIPDFRYAYIYNNTAAASASIIGSYDYGATVSITVGNTFTVAPDPTTGLLTLA